MMCKHMDVSYNKLWTLLIDKKHEKKRFAYFRQYQYRNSGQIRRIESVTTDVLVRVCHALSCDIGDIMEVFFHNTGVYKEFF